MFSRRPAKLSDIVNKTLRNTGLETPLQQLRLINMWNKVVEPSLVKYTGDRFIKNQVLWVKVLSPIVKAELMMRRSKLVNDLNAAVGSRLIVDIRFY